MAIKLEGEGGGVKTSMAWPLVKEPFFAASLAVNLIHPNPTNLITRQGQKITKEWRGGDSGISPPQPP